MSEREAPAPARGPLQGGHDGSAGLPARTRSVRSKDTA